MLKNLIALFSVFTFTSTVAFAGTQYTAYFSEDGRAATLNILDDPTSSTDQPLLEAAQIFDLMNVPVTQESEYQNPAKRISYGPLSIACSVPHVLQPSGQRYSACEVKVVQGEGVTISASEGLIQFRESNERTSTLLGLFHLSDQTGNVRLYWTASTKELILAGTKVPELDHPTFSIRFKKK